MADTKLPSSKAAERADLEEKIKAQKKDTEEFRKTVNRLFSTAEGKEVLKWMAKETGYGKSSMVVNPSTGEINVQSSLYMAARQTIYFKIRELLEPITLKEIEYD
jgi:hypothetical protein